MYEERFPTAADNSTEILRQMLRLNTQSYIFEHPVNPVIKSAVRKMIESSQQRVSGLFEGRVFTYEDEEYLQTFPTLKNLLKYDPNKLTWELHDESLYITLKKYEAALGRNVTHCNVWLLEDDVEYTGNWSSLFDKYRGTNDDFLGSRSVRRSVSSMKWNRHWTPAWALQFLSRDKTLKQIHEHVVRYSRTFLGWLFMWINQGKHCHSEYSGVNSAKSYSDLDMNDIAGDGHGKKYWSWGRDLSLPAPEVMRQKVVDLREKGQGKLLHPCKW